MASFAVSTPQGSPVLPPAKGAERLPSQRIVNIGFFAGLALAALSFLLALLYMHSYLSSVNSIFNDLVRGSYQGAAQLEVANLLIHGRLIAARFSLLSCGILTGFSLGFIGFCLFLVGARGDIEGTAETHGVKVTLSRLAPGALVLLCASVLIGICATHNITFGAEISGPHAPRTDQRGFGGDYRLPSEQTDPNP